MGVAIAAVLFNHQPGDTITGALSVRRNAAVPALLPEWELGVTDPPEESVAAYVMETVVPEFVTINAQLICDDPSIRNVEVRAIDPRTQWGWWSSAPNILGDVVPRRVTFSNGTTGLQPFNLRNVRLKLRGVGAFDVFWKWQFRSGPGHPWADCGLTAHRIYVTLGLPTLPWVNGPLLPGNTALTWTDALEFACAFARGQFTRAGITSAITAAIYALGTPFGGRLFEYGCPIGAITMYAFPNFNCTKFLERLRGGIGNGRFVNCTDCAAFVATLANALGCDLWESRMGEYVPSFSTNPILAIGTSTWNFPCGIPGGFMYHEVPWTDQCDSFDRVSDASIGYSGLTFAPPPGTPPIIATNMLFGLSGQGGFRDWLAAPLFRDVCHPRPAERVRRLVF
jgi:hypothetical protein